MDQDLQNALTATASDKLITASVGSYLDARTSTAATMLNDLEGLLSEEIDITNVETDLETAIPVQKDGEMLLVNANDLFNAAINDSDEFISNGVTFNYDDVTQQLAESIAAGYAAGEAVRSLGEVSNGSNITDIVSNFRSRMELKFAGLSDTAAGYGYLFIDALSDPHMPIKDKVTTLLNMIGIEQAQTYDGIGVPTSSFTDITGATVMTAFGAEVKDANVIGVVKKVGLKIWAGLGKIVNSVAPGIIETAKKTWKAIDGTWNAFKSSSEGVFPGFTDYGTTFKRTLQSISVPYGKTTLQDILLALHYITFDGDPIGVDIKNVADLIADEVNISYTSDGTIETAVKAIVNRYGIYNSVFGMLYNLQTIYDEIMVIRRPLAGIVDHLSENQYTVFETPASHIYVWIAEGYVYFKFYWIPILNPHECINYPAWSPFVGADQITDFMTGIAAWKTNGYGEFENDIKINLGLWNAKVITARYLGVLFAGVNGGVSNNALLGIIVNLFNESITYTERNVNNLELAQQLTSNTNGSVIDLSIGTEHVLLGDLIITSLGYSMGENYYAAYYQTNSTPIGQYNVIYDSDLANTMTNIVIAVAVVIAATASIIAIKKLSKRAYAMKTKADSSAWALAANPDASLSDIGVFYSRSRKADRLQSLIGTFSGSLKSAVSMSGSATKLFLASSMANGVSRMMGLEGSNDYTIKSLKKLIKD